MKNRFIFLLIPLLLSLKLLAQNTDTVLNMVLSKPYFYNVIQAGNGKVYAGTSEGIFEINGTNLSQYDSRTGYLITNKKGEPEIEASGIRFYKERQYQYLLPYPELDREEFHASTGSILYISSGGRLYVFDIRSYDYSFPNHSIRTISKDLVGTYSGIYLKGVKLGPPVSNYLDGYARQFGDRAFLCNYDLKILEKDALETGLLRFGENCFSYQEPNKLLINDIFPSPDNKYYYLGTQYSLIRADHNFQKDTLLFHHDQKDAPVVLITEDPYQLYFTADQAFYALQYTTGKIDSLTQLNETILAGIFDEFQYYLLSANGLYRLNSSQQLEKLADLEKAHSIVKISASEFVISSDQGLYLFNVANRLLSVIIKGVEFNRRALYRQDDKIYAGSLNGLYTLRINDIPKLIEDNKYHPEKDSLPNSFRSIVALLVVLVIILAALTIRFRRKLKDAETRIENSVPVPQEAVTREKIEEFVTHHLAHSSIKSIQENFGLNTTQLYAILKPDRPGSIIQKIRLARVKEMREQGKTIQEISNATGLSVSYLRKVKS